MGYMYSAGTPSVFHGTAVRVGELHAIKGGLTVSSTYSIAIAGIKAGVAKETVIK